jgi:hypothetical protein
MQMQVLLIDTDSDRKRPGLHGRKYTGECEIKSQEISDLFNDPL